MSIQPKFRAALGALLLLPFQAMAAQVPGTGLVVDAGVAVSYLDDDNVFYREEDVVGDSSLIISPRLALSSDLGGRGDSVALQLDYSRESYAAETALDNDEYKAAFEGVKQLGRSQRLTLSVDASKSVDGADNGANNFGDTPDTVETRALGLDYRYHAGAVPLRLTFGRDSYRYESLDAGNGGADPRDRDEVLASIRAGYAPAGDRGVYLQFTHGEIVDKADLADIASRDATSAEWLLGFRYRTPELLRLEANLGLYSLAYEDAPFDDVDEPVHALRLDFPLSPLTTLSFDSRKRFEMTRLEGSPGYQSLRNTLALEQALGRWIDLRIHFSRGSDTFLQSEVEDRTSEYGISGGWRLGRHLRLFAAASGEERTRSRVSLQQAEEATVSRRLLSLGIEAKM